MSANDELTGRSIPLGEIASRLGATLRGDPKIPIEGIRSLEDADSNDLSFLTHARYLPLVKKSRAAALIVSPSFAELDFPVLICDLPYLALARAAQLFAQPLEAPVGVHPRAHIDEGVVLGARVGIGPLAHVGSGTVIGDGTTVYGGAYLGCNLQIGDDCFIFPAVTIMDGAILGNRVVIHSGTVIGSDGFGYAQDEAGRHIKIPQTGIVQIDDDVEIGANCTIDRATFGRTWIQRGCKIDNLVQIAHNVVVGEHSILISQVGVSGSTHIGKHVVLAGQAGLVGHISIGDGARVGAKSGVSNSVKARQDVSGIPAVPHKEWLKNSSHIRRLSHYRDELRRLKLKVEQLEREFDQSHKKT
jgi:UDP-3-O-[3-hydroxymyristoyl] glucosamine N-acyltransferase